MENIQSDSKMIKNEKKKFPKIVKNIFYIHFDKPGHKNYCFFFWKFWISLGSLDTPPAQKSALQTG